MVRGLGTRVGRDPPPRSSPRPSDPAQHLPCGLRQLSQLRATLKMPGSTVVGLGGSGTAATALLPTAGRVMEDAAGVIQGASQERR